MKDAEEEEQPCGKSVTPVIMFSLVSAARRVPTGGSHVPVAAEGTAHKAIHLRRHAALWITSSKLTNAAEQSGI